MTDVEERVRGFLESRTWEKVKEEMGPIEEIKCDEKGPMIWVDGKRIQDLEVFVHCQLCGAELTDGKFKMIDGKLYCLNGHDKPNEPNDTEFAEQKNS